MTVFGLVLPTAFRTPSDAADYFRLGAEYTVGVTREMGWDVGDLPERVDNAYEAMRANETDVDDDVARLIAVVLAGDADFYSAFVRWFPWRYRVFVVDLDWALATFTPAVLAVVLVMTPVLHVVTNVGAYLLGLKNEPW